MLAVFERAEAGRPAAAVVGAATQGMDVNLWFHYITYGYDASALPALHGKGLVHMIELVTLIAVAGAFNGTLQYSKLADPLWESVIGGSRLLAAATVRRSDGYDRLVIWI